MPDPTLAELQRRLDELRGTFDAAASGLAVLDREGRVLDCNATAWKGLGLSSPDEILGRSAVDLVVENREGCIAALAELLADGATGKFECAVEWTGRARRRVECGFSLAGSGPDARIVCVMSDVAARARVNESLRLMNAMAIDLAAAAPGTDLYPLVTRCALQALHARAVLTASYDPSSAEMTVRALEVAPTLAPLVAQALGRPLVGLKVKLEPAFLNHMKAYEVDGPMPLADVALGNLSPAAAEALTRAGLGACYGLALMHRDAVLGGAIVMLAPGEQQSRDLLHLFANLAAVALQRQRAEEERWRLESSLLQTQKLESMGVLAGGVAHGFNNLLVGMLAHANLVSRELPPGSPARESVRQIEIAARAAGDLSRQMLAYAGKATVTRERTQLSALVEEMARLLEISLSRKCILKYRFANELPPVEVDRAQVRQVVLNLIGNASEAIGDEVGMISLSTGTRSCDRAFLHEWSLGEDLPAGTYVWVEVEDSGHGMPPEVLSRLFDPFFSTKHPGRGLGLAAVLGIVRSQRGAIEVRSEPGKGSAFRVYLPAVKGDLAPKNGLTPTALPRPPPQDWKTKGVALVADDEAIVRAAAKGILSRIGFKVLVSSDGQETVEQFKAHADEISLVLLDVNMPRLSGVDALREIVALRPNVKVILSSGYSEEDAMRMAKGLPIAEFAQKPYGVDELIALVKKVVEPE